MDFIGFDPGKVSSQICIITADGELLEQRIKTDREQLTKLLGARPRSRILSEAGTQSEWVARHLEALGHEVIVADPNFAPMYATRSRRVKTDRRDARTLAAACRLGAYRPAHRTSDAQHHVRAKLAVREAMGRTRARYISLIRALLRRAGFRVASGDVASFPRRLDALPLPAELRQEVAPLGALMACLNDQIKRADGELAALVRADPVGKRLTTAPGGGPVTAVCFKATLDDAARFASAKRVRAYLGLVPSEHSSGERQQRGRIAKVGSNRARYLLVEAAWTILRGRLPAAAGLHAWATRIRLRRGAKVTAVALARKLAGILYAMWRDGRDFLPRAERLLRATAA